MHPSPRTARSSAASWLSRGAGLVFSLASAACAGSEPATPDASVPVIRSLVLRDVHSLRGGQNLYLHADGTGVAQVVGWNAEAKAFYEQRYRVALAPAAMQRLQRLVRPASFDSSNGERPGVPGESRIRLFVELTSGKSASVSRWWRDRETGFDAIYTALIEEIRAASRGVPIHEGKLDPRWLPPGFNQVPQ